MHVITAIPMMKFAGKKKQSKDTFKLSYNINPPSLLLLKMVISLSVTWALVDQHIRYTYF